MELLNEVDRVAVFTAAETLEVIIWEDKKGRGFIGMKRADAHMTGSGRL